jgi:UPF0042 nucleotide-binding protein
MDTQVVIITGLSGSGKSTVAKTLEDLGFFCVDNIPVDLLPKLLELRDATGGKSDRLGLVIDLRQREFFPHYSSVFTELEKTGTVFDIVFLEARDEVLVRRYSETRRQHPMAAGGTVLDGIARERRELGEMRAAANWVIDTSEMTVHQLRNDIQKIFSEHRTGELKVVVTSFGFGKGVPMDSDLVLDVRFLPNPHFVPDLKPKTGEDIEVYDWVRSHAVTQDFIRRIEDLLSFLLPLYIREGKQYLTIAIGCTGGRHRSVVVAREIAELLNRNGYPDIEVRHRELGS